MTKVKVIKLSGFDLGPFDNLENLFEEKINRFIENRTILDIKYQTAISSSGFMVNPSDVIGNASVRRNETGLESDVIFYGGSEEFENSLKELISEHKLYIAGYYIAVKSHEEEGIRIIDSMRLASTFITYADVYGDDDLLIQIKED